MVRRHVPAETVGCSGVTAWHRLRDWVEAGVWPRLHAALLAELRRSGLLDLDGCSVDREGARPGSQGHLRGLGSQAACSVGGITSAPHPSTAPVVAQAEVDPREWTPGFTPRVTECVRRCRRCGPRGRRNARQRAEGTRAAGTCSWTNSVPRRTADGSGSGPTRSWAKTDFARSVCTMLGRRVRPSWRTTGAGSPACRAGRAHEREDDREVVRGAGRGGLASRSGGTGRSRGGGA